MSEKEFQAEATVDDSVAVKTKPKRKKKKKPRLLPPYHVIIWNDDDHSYGYVIEMLRALFGHPAPKGFLMAVELDTRGRVIALTTTKEHAELKRDQIHAYGKDDLVDGCVGSMYASIEPAR